MYSVHTGTYHFMTLNISKLTYYYDTIIRYYDSVIMCLNGVQKGALKHYYYTYDTIMTLL